MPSNYFDHIKMDASLMPPSHESPNKMNENGVLDLVEGSTRTPLEFQQSPQVISSSETTSSSSDFKDKPKQFFSDMKEKIQTFKDKERKDPLEKTKQMFADVKDKASNLTLKKSIMTIPSSSSSSSSSSEGNEGDDNDEKIKKSPLNKTKEIFHDLSADMKDMTTKMKLKTFGPKKDAVTLKSFGPRDGVDIDRAYTLDSEEKKLNNDKPDIFEKPKVFLDGMKAEMKDLTTNLKVKSKDFQEKSSAKSKELASNIKEKSSKLSKDITERLSNSKSANIEIEQVEFISTPTIVELPPTPPPTTTVKDSVEDHTDTPVANMEESVFVIGDEDDDDDDL